MTLTLTREQTEIDILNDARTKLLEAYLKLLPKQLEKAKKLGFDDKELYEFKVIRLEIGRRTGGTTWVKDMLKMPKTSVICPDSYKQSIYKGIEVVSINDLFLTNPTTFTDKVVFIDSSFTLVLSRELFNTDSFLHYCKCVVIV